MSPTTVTAVAHPPQQPQQAVSAEPPLPDCLLARSAGPWGAHGRGLFSWSVFRIYNATLWVQGPFDGRERFVLDLAYLRRVSATQIVEASIDEMRRLRALDEPRLAVWREQLLSFFPDVGLGDRLLGLFEPGHGVVFFSQSAQLGEVRDAGFAEAFSAVWLDPRTKAPRLRQALLGPHA